MSTTRKKKTGSPEEVYVVLSADVSSDEPIEVEAVGSYERKEDALKACTDYVMERLALRPDIRYALYNDVNHGKHLRRKLNIESGLSYPRLKRLFMAEEWNPPKRVEHALWCHVRLSLESDMAYYIDTDMFSDIGVTTYAFLIRAIEFHKDERRKP